MIDPDSLPAHALALRDALSEAAFAMMEARLGWSDAAYLGGAAVADAQIAKLEADGWTVRQEYRLCRKYRDGEWGDEPLVTDLPDYWVESRTVLTGPATKEKP